MGEQNFVLYGGGLISGVNFFFDALGTQQSGVALSQGLIFFF